MGQIWALKQEFVQGLIGWVVVEEFVGMMYFFGLKHYIIVMDDRRSDDSPPRKFLVSYVRVKSDSICLALTHGNAEAQFLCCHSKDARATVQEDCCINCAYHQAKKAGCNLII